jgi:serine/threonine protein kinase
MNYRIISSVTFQQHLDKKDYRFGISKQTKLYPLHIPPESLVKANRLIKNCSQCLEQYFLNYSLLNNIYLFFQSLMHIYQTQNILIPLKKYLLSEKKVLGKGKTSIAYLIHFKNFYPIVIKSLLPIDNITRQYIDNRNAMMHEYIMGVYLINSLRKMIPNYCFTYSVLSKPNNVKLFTEYIQGISIIEFIRQLSQKELTVENTTEFLFLILQILLAIQVAQDEIFFTHYDLHPHNIIIKTVQKPVTLHYPTIKGTWIFKNVKYIPMIIDFGHCSSVIQKTHTIIGREDNASRYGKQKYFNPSYDIHELFVCLYLWLYDPYDPPGTNLKKSKYRSNQMGHFLHHFFSIILSEYYFIQTTNPMNTDTYVNPNYYWDNYYNIYKDINQNYLNYYFNSPICMVDKIYRLSQKGDFDKHPINIQDILMDLSKIEMIENRYLLNQTSFSYSKCFEINFRMKFKHFKIPQAESIQDLHRLDYLIHNKNTIIQHYETLHTITNLDINVRNIQSLKVFIENESFWKDFLDIYLLYYQIIRLDENKNAKENQFISVFHLDINIFIQGYFKYHTIHFFLSQPH